jgi:hypothetical protein
VVQGTSFYPYWTAAALLHLGEVAINMCIGKTPRIAMYGDIPRHRVLRLCCKGASRACMERACTDNPFHVVPTLYVYVHVDVGNQLHRHIRIANIDSSSPLA